ncbi:g2257 [Coccomyxa viridis]|uniref:G2257 protein n=1 Tax=Coccomyxa viridis TaxID=1274662 RepID=A0ABP1FM67_9CHLO
MLAQGTTCNRATFFGNGLKLAAKPCQPRSHARTAVTALLKVRPYTVRKGDTLDLIAEKREVSAKEIIALNHGMDPKNIEEKQTILIPAGKLSSRDKEILAGIGPRSYRTYPVRSGEDIEDIISKRGITREEVDALNPDVNLDRLSAAQVMKLPAGKYTVREREMLSGVAGAPESYFMPGNAFSNSIIVALVAGCLYSAWLFKQKDEPDEDSIEA